MYDALNTANWAMLREERLAEQKRETEHGRMAQPVAGCFCEDCAEKRYEMTTRTIKTKFNRNARF